MSAASHVVSLSGGKDSTAMLLMLLESGEPVVDIVFFDTGWEFPAMYTHLEKLENYIGRRITVLQPRLSPEHITTKKPFDFMFSDYPVIRRGTNRVHKIGRGWASAGRRWCTGRKQEAIKSHLLALSYRNNVCLPLTQCIGFGADEAHRVDGPTKMGSKYVQQRFPLIEWGVTEAQALAYCQQREFTWNGLYEYFDRVSCFCCPLQPLNELRTLRRHFPDIWERMLEMESWLPVGCKGRRFKGETTVSDLDARFANEDAHNKRRLFLPGIGSKTGEV